MFTGLTVAACLLLAGDPGTGNDFTPMNTRRFEIPMPVDPAQRPDILELHVYASRNEGKTWDNKFTVPIPADDREVPKLFYEAKDDGMYWFTVSSVSKTSHLEDPPECWKGKIGQKILVDTIRPAITLHAERVGSKIQARWSIVEAHPMGATFRLEFQDPASGQWYTVPEARPGEKGTATFNPPPSSGPLMVRLSVKDIADNLGKAEVSVPAAAAPAPTEVAGTWPDANSTPVVKPMQPVPNETSYPPAGSNVLPVTPVNEPKPILGPVGAPVATASMNTPATQYGPPIVNPSLPPVKMVSQPHVKIEFGVDHCGPSGVGKVEVYLTTDDGMHWIRSASETPTLPQGDVGVQGQRAAIMVNIPKQEIVYGIYLVIKNGAGVGGPAPQDGKDRPMMRVEVDSLRPEADLFQPMADKSHQGVLLLMWKATDRNLEENPISIEYSTDPKSNNWQYVSATQFLPNTGAVAPACTGSYAWRVPNIPQGLVYLRLTVRDKAGNVSEATTLKPVLIDLSEPVPVEPVIVTAGP